MGLWVLKWWKSWVNPEELATLRLHQLWLWYNLWWTNHITSPYLISLVQMWSYHVFLFYRRILLPYQTSLNNTAPIPEQRYSSGCFFCVFFFVCVWENPETGYLWDKRFQNKLGAYCQWQDLEVWKKAWDMRFSGSPENAGKGRGKGEAGSRQLVRVLFSRKKSMLGNSMNRVQGNCQAGIQITVRRTVLSRN